MKVQLLLGWRNLQRRKWRSWLTGLMFFLGTYLLVFTVGLGEGAYSEMIEIGTLTFSGDFQIMAEGYKDKPTLFKSVKDYEDLTNTLRKDDRVAGISCRIEAPGLLSKGNATMGALVVGMEPEHEFVTIMDSMVEGAWWQSYGDEIPMVLGSGAAKRLKAGLGDEITYIGQAADGSIAAELFVVAGILDSGVDELDRSLAAIPLDAAQELLVLAGRVHRIVGKASDKDVLRALTADAPIPPGITMLRWDQITPELAETIEADRQGLYLFLFILMAVVLLGVANTMMMSVMERGHELGVIQALGTTPSGIVGLVLSEIFWLSLLGVTAGVVLGVITNIIAAHYGIPTGAEDLNYGGVALAVMRPTNTLESTLVYPLMIMVSGIAAGFFPALKAAYASPAAAMRD